MDLTRKVAARLATAGMIQVEQKRAPLDPKAWDAEGRPGIVRLRLAEGRRLL